MVIHVNKASQFGYSEDIYKTGLVALKDNLNTLIAKPAWEKVQENVLLDLIDDENLAMSEGDLFTAMVDWCKGNTNSEEEAVEFFQAKFADKVMVKNISQDTFLSV